MGGFGDNPVNNNPGYGSLGYGNNSSNNMYNYNNNNNNASHIDGGYAGKAWGEEGPYNFQPFDMFGSNNNNSNNSNVIAKSKKDKNSDNVSLDGSYYSQ